ARPAADRGVGGAVSAGSGNHEERIFVSGGSGRNRAGIRRVSETDDETGWRQSALRSRWIDKISGRIAERRADGLHPGWADVRSRWRAVDGERSAPCGHLALHFVQL